jgi:tetratricopeptide (TPR) repeat protein
MKNLILLLTALITLPLTCDSVSGRSDNFSRVQQAEAESYFQKGLEQQKNGQFEAAIKSFQKAIELDPKFISAYHFLGFSYAHLEKYPDAIKLFLKTVELDPYFFLAHASLGGVYIRTKEYSAAARSLERALALIPGLPVLGDLALAYEQLGRTEDLKRLFGESVWWQEQLEAIKAHVRQLKDQEDGKTNILDMTIDLKPTILYREKAKYTNEARRMGVTGIVKLRAIFDVDRTPKDFLVLEGLDWGLSWASIEAARKITFKPAIIDGAPVAVTGYLEFSFNLWPDLTFL